MDARGCSDAEPDSRLGDCGSPVGPQLGVGRTVCSGHSCPRVPDRVPGGAYAEGDDDRRVRVQQGPPSNGSNRLLIDQVDALGRSAGTTTTWVLGVVASGNR